MEWKHTRTTTPIVVKPVTALQVMHANAAWQAIQGQLEQLFFWKEHARPWQWSVLWHDNEDIRFTLEIGGYQATLSFSEKEWLPRLNGTPLPMFSKRNEGGKSIKAALEALRQDLERHIAARAQHSQELHEQLSPTRQPEEGNTT